VVEWYVQLIQFIFVTHDGEKIVKIKVPTHEIGDTIARHYERMASSRLRMDIDLPYL
jgi:hypothetical protein